MKAMKAKRRKTSLKVSPPDRQSQAAQQLVRGDDKAWHELQVFDHMGESVTTTSAMEIASVGCILRVSTSTATSVHEAVTFVPNVRIQGNRLIGFQYGHQ
jgi:hypothetical protein